MSRPKSLKGCMIFYCDKKRTNQCCAKCNLLQKCDNHCLNSPEKCQELTELKKKTSIHKVAKKTKEEQTDEQ